MKFLKFNINITFSISLFLIMVILNACYNEHEYVVTVPEKIISHDTMVNIFTDMSLINGIVMFNNLNRIKGNNIKNEYLNKMLIQYNITEKELQENIDYYATKYDEMSVIYDEVIKRLTEIQEKLKKEKQKKENRKVLKIPPSPVWLIDSNAVLIDSIFAKHKLPAWIDGK